MSESVVWSARRQESLTRGERRVCPRTDAGLGGGCLNAGWKLRCGNPVLVPVTVSGMKAPHKMGMLGGKTTKGPRMLE